MNDLSLEEITKVKDILDESFLKKSKKVKILKRAYNKYFHYIVYGFVWLMFILNPFYRFDVVLVAELILMFGVPVYVKTDPLK